MLAQSTTPPNNQTLSFGWGRFTMFHMLVNYEPKIRKSPKITGVEVVEKSFL